VIFVTYIKYDDGIHTESVTPPRYATIIVLLCVRAVPSYCTKSNKCPPPTQVCHDSVRYRPLKSAMIPPESALDLHGASTGHKLFILFKISGALLMFDVKSQQ